MTIFRYKPLNWQKSALLESESKVVEYLASLGFGGRVFHLLVDVPEQYEDIYVVMIDAETIVSFEVPHDSNEPQDVQVMPINSYKRHVRGVAAKECKAAVEEAQKLLGKRL
jgi:hypothetical protein